MVPDHRRPPPRGPIGWGDALTAAHQLGLAMTEQLGALVDLLGLRAPGEEAPLVVTPLGRQWTREDLLHLVRPPAGRTPEEVSDGKR